MSAIERSFVHVQNGRFAAGGTVISDRLVVTAAHLFRGHGSLSVAVPGGYRYRARLAGVDRNRDVAVVEVLANQVAFPSPAPMADTDAPVGTRITRVGHPYYHNRRYPEITSGAIIGVWPLLASGPAYVIDMRTVSGHSGSGVFNGDGEFIGLVPWAADRGTRGIVQPVSAVRRLLDRCRKRRRPPLRPPVVEPPPPPSMPDPPAPSRPAITGVVAHIGPVRAELIDRILHIWIPAPIRGIDGDDGVSPVLDLDLLTDKVIEKLPPVRMEIHDGDEVFLIEKPLGESIKIRVEGLLDARSN